jgi:hypothetical protein
LATGPPNLIPPNKDKGAGGAAGGERTKVNYSRWNSYGGVHVCAPTTEKENLPFERRMVLDTDLVLVTPGAWDGGYRCDRSAPNYDALGG